MMRVREKMVWRIGGIIYGPNRKILYRHDCKARREKPAPTLKIVQDVEKAALHWRRRTAKLHGTHRGVGPSNAPTVHY